MRDLMASLRRRILRLRAAMSGARSACWSRY